MTRWMLTICLLLLPQLGCSDNEAEEVETEPTAGEEVEEAAEEGGKEIEEAAEDTDEAVDEAADDADEEM